MSDKRQRGEEPGERASEATDILTLAHGTDALQMGIRLSAKRQSQRDEQCMTALMWGP